MDLIQRRQRNSAYQKKRIREDAPYREFHYKRVAVNTLRLRRRKKAWALSLLGGRCSRRGCEEARAAALDLHHKGGTNDLTQSIYSLSWPRLKAEVKKCVILCRNDHAVHHWGREERRPNGPPLSSRNRPQG